MREAVRWHPVRIGAYQVALSTGHRAVDHLHRYAGSELLR